MMSLPKVCKRMVDNENGFLKKNRQRSVHLSTLSFRGNLNKMFFFLNMSQTCRKEIDSRHNKAVRSIKVKSPFLQTGIHYLQFS